jgi:D-alanyl-D-alanine carboxypeptidase
MMFSSKTGFWSGGCSATLLFSLAFQSVAMAGSSILVDVTTGKVLAQDHAFQRSYPASVTKLMTSYIAFRAVKAGKLTQYSPVIISPRAAKQPPSKMGYKPGNKLTLDNALKIMLVKSANDIAVAVGETVGGANYPDLMNAEAKRLGMTGSHFVNANGLHDNNHYTTARDMAILSVALRTEFPEFAFYFNVEAIQYGKTVEPNYNLLLGRYAGADGMKTGFVCASGYNMVASATRAGHTLVAVVFGELTQEDRADRAAMLLSKGFAAPDSGMDTLATLKPSGEETLPAVNMRDIACKKGAAESHWGGRDVEGKMTFASPDIILRTTPPTPVFVGLIPAPKVDKTKLKGTISDTKTPSKVAKKPKKKNG